MRCESGEFGLEKLLTKLRRHWRFGHEIIDSEGLTVLLDFGARRPSEKGHAAVLALLFIGPRVNQGVGDKRRAFIVVLLSNAQFYSEPGVELGASFPASDGVAAFMASTMATK